MPYIKIEFPCGYKMVADGWTIDFNVEDDYPNGCPLHGKKCPIRKSD